LCGQRDSNAVEQPPFRQQEPKRKIKNIEKTLDPHYKTLTAITMTNTGFFELTIVGIALTTSVVILTTIVDTASTTRSTIVFARVLSNNESLRIAFLFRCDFASTGATA
jgi:hypothetical protein